MGKRVAVILSGCGVKDGSEIHESVLSLYFLDKHGAEVICTAPNKAQTMVVDHKTGEQTKESRNVLVEAARIARGNIVDIKTLNADEFDGALLPGGFGAALNLSDFGLKGDGCTVEPSVSVFLKQLHSQRKPIAALCIAPAVISRLFGADSRVIITIGTDKGTADKLSKMGAKHVDRQVDEIAVDEVNKIITTPCYMLAKSINELGVGIEKAVQKLLALA